MGLRPLEAYYPTGRSAALTVEVEKEEEEHLPLAHSCRNLTVLGNSVNYIQDVVANTYGSVIHVSDLARLCFVLLVSAVCFLGWANHTSTSN